MDFEKVMELERALAEYKKGMKEEEEARRLIRNSAPELRIIAANLYKIARRFDGMAIPQQFGKYQDILKDKLHVIAQMHNITKKQQAVDIGVSEGAFYNFTSMGITRTGVLVINRIEKYLEDHGNDIDSLKEQAGFE